ncbi:hypothetical protein OENI_460008 [Oenococcus oeni]|nr:hypothetical protein OENI_460008 [Oenococcus oeni]
MNSRASMYTHKVNAFMTSFVRFLSDIYQRFLQVFATFYFLIAHICNCACIHACKADI